jgi:hypothetical protein
LIFLFSLPAAVSLYKLQINFHDIFKKGSLVWENIIIQPFLDVAWGFFWIEVINVCLDISSYEAVEAGRGSPGI